MPDHIGAFLKASECFSALGINITRVSYNKAVDSHTLFIDAEGTEEQLRKADTELNKIGYLQSNAAKTGIVLNWEDKASISRFIDLCWKNHLKGELTVEDADISRFTRRNLTRRMAQLFKENEK